MTLLLNLTLEQEARLRELAAERGQPVDQCAHGLFDDLLSSHTSTPRPFYETATTEEWLAAFHEWVESHDPGGPVLLDDRREVIYGD